VACKGAREAVHKLSPGYGMPDYCVELGISVRCAREENVRGEQTTGRDALNQQRRRPVHRGKGECKGQEQNQAGTTLVQIRTCLKNNAERRKRLVFRKKGE